MSRPSSEFEDSLDQQELRRLLDAELSRLPEEYRAPVVLCYLEGQTNEEAARQIGCPVGTVKFRLSRAKELLHKRLARRGLALSLVLLAEGLAAQAKAATPAPTLVNTTVDTAIHYGAGAALAGSGAGAAELAEGVLQIMKANPAAFSASAKVRHARSGGKVASSQAPLKAGKLSFRIKAGLALALLVAGLVLVVYLTSSRVDPAVDPALARLKEVQREWWDGENLARGSPDPNLSINRLLERQRDWWVSEGLAKDGNRDGEAALGRLQEQQQTWFKSEGLADGKPGKDSAAALARLDKVNRQWWLSEGIVRAGPPPGPTVDVTASLDDLNVPLLEAESTRRYRGSGGTDESEKAVQLGLQWLAAQQLPEGCWPAKKVTVPAVRGSNRNWIANNPSLMTNTALALLPFLARGETHKGSDEIHLYSKVVERGLKFLLAQQKADGDLRGGSNMYTHALGTMALAEALSMTGDDAWLRKPAQQAVDFLLKAQARDGGWRYTPNPPFSDLSVTSWCLMALKSAQMAGLQIPREKLEQAAEFLKSVSRPDGGYNYVTQGKQSQFAEGVQAPKPATMTALGMVCRQYLQSSSGDGGESANPRSPAMTRGLDLITANLPGVVYEDRGGVKGYSLYYYYYSTYALFQIGGDAWESWNPRCRDLLIRMQNQGQTDPSLKGSWHEDSLLPEATRVGNTALALLTLEVYYRHLPLNRPELGEITKDLNATGPAKAPRRP